MTSIYFDPEGRGLEVFLGPTEARLMELVWRNGPVTVKKALFLWDRSPKPAYTTVMTILTRLSEKGILERVRDGKSFLYRPAVDRNQFLADQLEQVIACLKRNFPAALG